MTTTSVSTALIKARFIPFLSCITEVKKHSSVCFFVVAGKDITSDSLLHITVVEIFCVNFGTLLVIMQNNSILKSLFLRNFLKSLCGCLFPFTVKASPD